jgi:hypothetical protein
MADAPIAAMFGVIAIQDRTITQLHTLAVEWHGKHLTDERFAQRVYSILVAHQKEMDTAAASPDIKHD